MREKNPEEELKEAFRVFDAEGTGVIGEQRKIMLMMNMVVAKMVVLNMVVVKIVVVKMVVVKMLVVKIVVEKMVVVKKTVKD